MYDNDKPLFDSMCKNLYSAVISDTLDELGYRHQVMREDLTPLSNDWVIAGRAKTMLSVDVHHLPDDPYAQEIAAVDSIKPGEIVIGCTNRSRQNGLWGELLSTASQARGAHGAVVDGLIRDSKKILELDFPVFATGTKPVDSRGRGLVIEYDVPVLCGDVLVHPGDVVFGDRDGVVVIPAAVVDEVVRLAMDKVTRENHTRDELKAGRTLREVYDKYGVL
ncbi:RraA family protein [Paenibacillus sp. MZ04-78.2]|uniref:RraA family protein n=1 Tax=Paenibacillus sp. MZ04-78.2 TaxID=2962034 RepID=UPI0020B8DDCB|nr:RraA family protein [Paenibacillus sp. MZ04-78.2]MCP3774189.1 RraA family protein [Paenibacillus sp. MZ04-78.2]